MLPELKVLPDGRVVCQYGGSKGCQTFASMDVARPILIVWIHNEYDLLAKEMAALGAMRRKLQPRRART